MKYKVLITDPISDSGISILKNNNCDIIDCVNDKNKIDKIISEIDGWIIRSGTKISSDNIKMANKLQVIGRAGVGIDILILKLLQSMVL